MSRHKGAATNNPKLHFRRFEFKYVLPTDTVERLLPELLTHMEWDPYVLENDFYEVNSLYFDSPSFKNYYEKLSGILHRKKPRIRVYSKHLDSESVLYLEVKKKYGDIIVKDRSASSLKTYRDLMKSGYLSSASPGLRAEEAAEFMYEIMRYSMRPAVLVSYKRKPLVGKHNSQFRVTFDYDIEAALPNGDSFEAEYTPVNEGQMVLEVKYNGDMPRWFHGVIERYGLKRTSYSKYCESVAECYSMREQDEAGSF